MRENHFFFEQFTGKFKNYKLSEKKNWTMKIFPHKINNTLTTMRSSFSFLKIIIIREGNN